LVRRRASALIELTDALKSTSATLAFDAVGGGKLAGQILTSMEVAASAAIEAYSRCGSSTHKLVYIYVYHPRILLHR
jgi:hypothetical protein